jgi:hypothetical protein
VIYTLIAFVASAFLVITGFVFVFSVKRVLDSGVWCPWWIKLVARIWLVVGLFSDVAFNWLWGTIIFREFPQELVFTARVKRHALATGWRGERARRWAAFLNAVDPGHV